MKITTDSFISFKGNLFEPRVHTTFTMRIYPVAEKSVRKISWRNEEDLLRSSLSEYVGMQWDEIRCKTEKFYEGEGKDAYGKHDIILGIYSDGSIPTFSTKGNSCFLLKKYWDKDPEDSIALYLGKIPTPGRVVGQWYTCKLCGDFNMEIPHRQVHDSEWQ